MTQDTDIRVQWDQTQGAVEVVLPSGTRVAFKKESGTFVFSFLNWVCAQPKETLRVPLTQKQIDSLRKRFFAAGNIAIVALRDAPQGGVTLEALGL